MKFGEEITKREGTEKVIDCYLDFKAYDKKFEYYDQELGQKVGLELTDFIVLKVGFILKGGWDNDNNCGLYSNELDSFDLNKEEFYIRSFKGGVVLKGLYSDIKEELKTRQINLHRTLTVLSEGKVIRIALKSKGMVEIGNLLDEVDINEYKIEFSEYEENKYGGKLYYVPLFKKGKKITTSEATKAKELVDKLSTKEEVKDNGPEEDLPF